MSTGSNTILVATHLIPYPPARGVELRILNLLKWLHSEGYRVVLVTAADSIDATSLSELRKVTHAVHWLKPALRTRIGMRFPFLRKVLWERLKRVPKRRDVVERQWGGVASPDVRDLGDNRRKRELCPQNLASLTGKLARRYKANALIAEYVFLTPCFNDLPPHVLKLVDTHDVFSQKPKQVLAYGIDDPQACSEEEEREYLLRADAIIAIQSREAELLRCLVPEREVVLVGIDFDVNANEPGNTADPDNIAVIGSDNALNVHGLRGFLEECWPQIKGAHPAATLHVVGRVGDSCLSGDQAIRFSRWIPDLEEVYRNARVIINPTIAGTGLKIKSAQALAYGKPLVAWTNGVEGLDYVGSPPYIECQSWKEFSEAVISVLRSTSEAEQLSARALAYASEAFEAVAVYTPLKLLLAKHLNSPCSKNQQRRQLSARADPASAPHKCPKSERRDRRAYPSQ